MNMFCIEMEDRGKYSYERYYVCAKNEEDAEKLFVESYEGSEEKLKRPHSITKYEQGEIAVEIY